MKKSISIVTIILIALLLLTGCGSMAINPGSTSTPQLATLSSLPPKAESSQVNTQPLPTNKTDNDGSKYKEALAQISTYQDTYFEICKKGKLFDQDDEAYRTKESNLFNEVTLKISQENLYLKQYKEIETELSNPEYYKTDDAGDDFHPNPITVYDIQYRRFDEYLNAIYADIKNKIPDEDFNALKNKEGQWIKDKETYLKGTYFQGDESYPETGEFQVDATKFRCLLLVLYISYC